MIAMLLEKHLAGYSAERILDVGPGYAEFSRIAARITGASHITFLDYNESVLTWQMNRCRQDGIGASAWRTHLDRSVIAQSNSRYDLIHCQEVLEHLPDAAETLRVLVNLLNPGGRMIVTVPTAASERWLKRINPAYMRDEPHGHVTEFDGERLAGLIRDDGLEILAFVPTQPHYLLAHTWLFGTRMKIEGSTGKVLTGGFRGLVLGHLTSLSRRFFLRTGPEFWGKVFPRTYFVVAAKGRR
jgi:SAM-dependent methyltransferase